MPTIVLLIFNTADPNRRSVTRPPERAGVNNNCNPIGTSSSSSSGGGGDGSIGSGVIVRPNTESGSAADKAPVSQTLNLSAITGANTMKIFKCKQLQRATSKVKKKRKRLSLDDATAAIAANRSSKHNNNNRTSDFITTNLVRNNYSNMASDLPPLSLSLPTTYSTIIKAQQDRDKSDNKTPRKLSLPVSLSTYAPLVTLPPPTKSGKQHFGSKTDLGLTFSLSSKAQKSNTTTTTATTTTNSNKSNRKLAKLLKARLSMSNAYSPHAKCRKSSAASIVETALAAAGVNVHLTNASISSASATELLTAYNYDDTATAATAPTVTVTAAKAGGDYLPTAGPFLFPSSHDHNYSSGSTHHKYQRHFGLRPEDSSECDMSATASPTPPFWCSGLNFVVYMVCSLCCCCYNLRNNNDNNNR